MTEQEKEEKKYEAFPQTNNGYSIAMVIVGVAIVIYCLL
jgi:hypothetical protein